MMRHRVIATSLAILVIAAGALIGGTRPGSAASQGGEEAMAVMMNQAGEEIGIVSFAWEGAFVRVRADVSGLTPGFHGFHIHANGVCDPSVGFESAGGHMNPAGATHADHAGDMSSLYVNADGTASYRIQTDRFTIGELVANGGRAVMIHADPDNFAHIPARYGVTPDEATLNTGDAGARMACGVITPMSM
jgi:superoxide dismutase, Cu-Zn family